MVNGLGWRLENLRDQAEYSQKEISSKLGFSQNTYGQYEREERTPSIETLIQLANLFNVSLDLYYLPKHSVLCLVFSNLNSVSK